MDKLAAMRAFVEIVDRGSLTAAAAALDRSLPTMVRTLASLERAIGAALLRRTTRRMSLTEEGRLYLERCRRILADVEQAEELVGSGRAEPRGPLRVTAPVLFGHMHVAPAVIEFVRRHPAVQVELLLLDRVVDLVDEGVDAAVRIARLADSSLIAIPVGQVRRVVCASPALLRAEGEPARPEELAGLPCVRFRGLTPGSTWHFDDAGRDLAVAVRGGFTTNQASAAVEACVAGLGFGLFLSYQIDPQLRARRLRTVLGDFEPPPLPVSLVHADARLLSLRLRVFLDWMKTRLRARLARAAVAAQRGSSRRSAAKARESGLGPPPQFYAWVRQVLQKRCCTSKMRGRWRRNSRFRARFELREKLDSQRLENSRGSLYRDRAVLIALVSRHLGFVDAKACRQLSLAEPAVDSRTDQ